MIHTLRGFTQRQVLTKVTLLSFTTVLFHPTHFLDPKNVGSQVDKDGSSSLNVQSSQRSTDTKNSHFIILILSIFHPV